jgi:hypothetical protein
MSAKLIRCEAIYKFAQILVTFFYKTVLTGIFYRNVKGQIIFLSSMPKSCENWQWKIDSASYTSSIIFVLYRSMTKSEEWLKFATSVV